MARVVHLLPDFAVAGGPRYLLNLITSSPADSAVEHQVAAVADGPMRPMFEAAGVRTHVLGQAGPSRFRGPVAALVRLVHREGVDIVHINGTPDERIIGQLAAARCKVVVVNTFHGVALGDLAPSRHALTRDGAKRRVRTAVSRRLIRLGDQKVVAVSELVRDSHARALRLPRDAFLVVNPGLPDELFESVVPATRAAVRSELAVADDDLVVMNVARFDPGKGQDVLIDAFLSLGDNPNLQLVLVGDGPTRAELHDAVRKRGVEERVMFLGSRDDVPRLLQGADIFANASTNEGFGIAPLEAMAAGLPVAAVTGPNNAVGEFIDDGATGLLVDDTGPAALAAAIELLTDDQLRARLGASARRAARQWSASRSVDRLEQLYRELVKDATSCVVVDSEGQIGVDHGAVRLGSLSTPGWGREAVGLGPHQPSCGRAFFVDVLNGHNGSELTVRWPSPLWYAYNHLLGTRTEKVVTRLLARLRGRGRLSLRQQLVRLVNHRRASRSWPAWLDTNLAVGWIGAPLQEGPLGAGHGFTVVAREAVNGDLRASVCGEAITIIPELQNVGMSLAVVLRDRGALLCVDEGLLGGESGRLRPVAIDPEETPPRVWAAVHQSMSGQFGWTVDTRVRSTAVHDLPAATDWYTFASVADELIGDEELTARSPDRGPEWRVTGTDFHRTDRGVSADRVDGVALVESPDPVSLVHVALDRGASGGLVVRAHDATTGWFVWLDGSGGVRVERRDGVGGTEEHRAASPRPGHPPSSLQVLDDGRELAVLLDGVRTMTVAVDGTAEGTQLGLATSDACPLRGISRFEAHPRSIDPGVPVIASQPSTHRVERVLHDDFAGSGPLAGRTIGRDAWRQAVGTRPGDFVLDGDSALVRVSPESSSKVVRNLAALTRPTAGRIAYTLPWRDPAAVGLSAEVLPPGTRSGAGERGRAGLILWQNADNYVVVSTWLDDAYAGVSLSSFYRIDGFEELFDAVWTNVGTRIRWGQPYRLDLDFVDGWFELRLDGAPMLERSITDVVPTADPLDVTEVGLVANWEFGNDTGSRFTSFSAHRLTVDP